MNRQSWIERLRLWQWKLLVVAVAVSVLTAAGWLVIAANDGRTNYPTVAPGATHHADGATWTLTRLTAVSTLPDGHRPVNGAAFVIADMQADLSSLPLNDSCLWRLHAGEWEFGPEIGYLPADPAILTSCQPGHSGMVSVAFEVPTKLLDLVDGVVLTVADQPAVVLAGRIG